ncbi:MAG: translational GTPase TypA [Deltaproteobacteria bacterium]|nr:MAG: translational GTPase TypA [Deltaproteobacteria bacterium]
MSNHPPADTPPSDLRNVAIIAHVDHGKTTLVDSMLRQTGVYRRNEEVRDCALDSGDIERERGITILAKHTSVNYQGTRINIIDTPGHADFGGEVERTLLMADAALLLVDAAEGPLPQTRFVLKEALELHLPVIVVINKIDRDDARPEEVVTEVFDLFCELDASDEQTDFPTLYAIGKNGIAKRSLDDDDSDLTALFETIIEQVPPPSDDPDGPLQLLVTNVEHDDHVGRLAVGRITRGRIAERQTVTVLTEDGSRSARVMRLYGFVALQRKEITNANAGDIVAIAGMDEVQISDTITDPAAPEPLARLSVEEPTIKVQVVVNTSPLGGKSGKWVTSRQLRDRLTKATKRDLSLRFEPTDAPDTFLLYGRGELVIAILAETMRREGYELALGMPEVVLREEEDGKQLEPVERMVIDVPDEYVGVVTQGLGARRGQLESMGGRGAGRTRLEFRVPARGLIGYRSQLLTDTRGTALINTLFDGWIPYAGPMLRRKMGAMVCDRTGTTTPYALFHLQPRGQLFVGPGTTIYEGMVIGAHNRVNDLVVNAAREKKLTNMRAAHRDENVILSGHKDHTIESALEWIDRDELVEITPDAIRIRKRILAGNIRPRRRDHDGAV